MGKLLILALIMIHFLCHGEDMTVTPEMMKATEDTKAFMRNQKERDAYVQKDARAKDVDAKAEALVGKDGKDKMYDMAADITQVIAIEAKGDPDKMQVLLLEAQKDPEAFFKKYMTETQRQQVREMASKIEKQGIASPGHH